MSALLEVNEIEQLSAFAPSPIRDRRPRGPKPIPVEDSKPDPGKGLDDAASEAPIVFETEAEECLRLVRTFSDKLIAAGGAVGWWNNGNSMSLRLPNFAEFKTIYPEYRTQFNRLIKAVKNTTGIKASTIVIHKSGSVATYGYFSDLCPVEDACLLPVVIPSPATTDDETVPF
jgi:hypothetical protein